MTTPQISKSSLIAAVVFMSALYAGRAEETATKIPTLDIVVTSSIKLPKEQLTSYVEMLGREAADCFRTLHPTLAKSGEKLKDGAAVYRLLIDHKGTLTIGGITGGDRIDKGTEVTGGSWSRTWFIDCRQDGTFQFRLMKWDETKYTEVDKWSAPMPKPPKNFDAPEGKMVVASLGGMKNIPDKGKCPIALPDAQRMALDSVHPTSLKEALCTRLVAITEVTADAPKDGKSNLTFTVENKTPWDIQWIQPSIVCQGKVYGVGRRSGKISAYTLFFTEPLHGGEQKKLTQEGEEIVSTIKTNTVYSVQFSGK